jgi:hypothetical protein
MVDDMEELPVPERDSSSEELIAQDAVEADDAAEEPEDPEQGS